MDSYLLNEALYLGGVGDRVWRSKERGRGGITLVYTLPIFRQKRVG
jgi:hypothetical protein